MDNEEKKPEWEINYKRIAIIAVILVGFHLWGMFGGYQWISEISPIYNEMPVGMANPITSKQCAELVEEYTELKDFLGVGDFLEIEQIEEMSWSDYTHYVRLDMKIRELQCTLEPDT